MPVIHVTAIFQAPTISKFAKYIEENYNDKYYQLLGEKPAESATEIKDSLISGDTFDSFRKLIPTVPKLSYKISRKNKKAIFILSAPRTGSTLLRVMLAGHTKLFAPPELDLMGFNALSDRKQFYSGLNQSLSEGPIHALMQLENCSVDEAFALFEKFQEKNLNISEFYAELQNRLGNRILVDKTPGYSINIDVLNKCEQLFDDALYIHLLRHPYGMINSYEHARLDLLSGSLKKELNLSSRNIAELIYTISNQNINKFLETIPTHRKFVLKYEDLVNEPQKIISKMCEFIGIDFEPAMLKPYEDKNKKMIDGIREGGLMIGDIKFNTHKYIDVQLANRWKEYIKKDFLSDITKELTQQYHYELLNKK